VSTDDVREDEENAHYDERVWARVEQLRIDYEARVRFQQALAPTEPLTFSRFGDRVETAQRWVVEHILPEGAFVLVVAQAKTGKTTAMLNLAESLLTTSNFLGFEAEGRYARRVAYLNTDMDSRLFGVYGEHLHIDELLTVHLSATGFDVMNETQMAELRDCCVANDVGVVIIDVWNTVFRGDENDNSEVRQAMNRLSALRTEANLDALIVLHHSGWGRARARGASAFEGAVDVIWRLQTHGNGIVTFRADGRIPQVPKVVMGFDAATWRVFGDNTDESRHVLAEAEDRTGRILDAIGEKPGVTKTELRELIGGRYEDINADLEALVADLRVNVVSEGRRQRHFLAE
jgi:hypothetical protein